MVRASRKHWVRRNIFSSDRVEENQRTIFLERSCSRTTSTSIAEPPICLLQLLEEKAKYPRFKSLRKSRLSLRYTKAGVTVKGGQVKLAKHSKPLNIVWSRDVDGLRLFLSPSPVITQVGGSLASLFLNALNLSLLLVKLLALTSELKTL